jgi:hypothetical protein
VRRPFVLLAVAGALAALSALLWRPSASVVTPPGPRRTAPRTPRPVPGAPVAATIPDRNVFEFAEAAPARPVAPAREPEPPPAVAPPSAVETAAGDIQPVRLIGLVHRGGGLRAALSILGNVVILGEGEEAEGYRVLSIDEEAGVRLRKPDGTEQSLARPATP